MTISQALVAGVAAATIGAEPEVLPKASEKSAIVAKIISHPDSRLRELSRPCAMQDAASASLVRQLVMAMREAMYDRGGIGLAAVQIGVPLQLFIVHVPGETSGPLVFLNPEILSVSPDKCEMTEGCLSIGLERDLVERPRACVVRRFDEWGRRDVHEYKGLTARVIQHEYDHLFGKLFIDYLSPMRQKIIDRNLRRRSKKRNFAGMAPKLRPVMVPA